MPNSTKRLTGAVSALKAASVATVTLLAALSLEAVKAQADDLIVRYDQSQLLRLPRPVAEIIIGNPSIADVTVQGGNLLVVTGKSFGLTNIIALDAEKNIIQDQRVMVERDQHNVVNLHRGNLRQTYSCTPNCAPMVTVGDDPDFFSRTLSSNQAKNKAGEAGGGEAGGGGGQ
jgi:Pilus formation protein N terminal region